MHLYMLTRGIKHEIDRYINDLQAQYFPYVGNSFVQLSIRPIQLFEIVFPKSSLIDVMGTIVPRESWKSWRLKDRRKKFLEILRLTLGAKKIPELDLTQSKARIVYNQNIAVYPFGIKEDEIWTEGEFKDYERL